MKIKIPNKLRQIEEPYRARAMRMLGLLVLGEMKKRNEGSTVHVLGVEDLRMFMAVGFEFGFEVGHRMTPEQYEAARVKAPSMAQMVQIAADFIMDGTTIDDKAAPEAKEDHDAKEGQEAEEEPVAGG